MILLRFRDLMIPDGETIARHNMCIQRYAAVWWGWIMRPTETYPVEFMRDISREASASPITIYLFDSGTNQVYPATLVGVHAFATGHKQRSPSFPETPRYMRESLCPVWFRLTEIRASLPTLRVRIAALPTLPNPPPADRDLTGSVITSGEPLRTSAATLWAIG